jgi:hypothetical protein
MEDEMMSSRVLAGVSALALVLAAPTATFARGPGGIGGGGGGGAHIGGGGGGSHFSCGGGGTRMGGGGGFSGARMGGGNFGAAHVSGGNFGAARVGGGYSGARVGAVGPAYSGARVAGGNWHGGHGGYYRHGRFFPFAAGIAAGAALGSYAYYNDPYYYDDGSGYYADNSYYDDGVTVAVPAGGGDASYCAQRYRSWDPASQTYLGYDGQRHPCP